MASTKSPADPSVLAAMLAELDSGLSPRVRERLLLVYNHARGQSIRKVAATFAVSVGCVAWWVARYREEGLAGLEDRQGRGRPRALTQEQEEWLRKRVNDGPKEADGGLSRWRGTDLQALIAAEFGVELGLQTVYSTLHRLELSWICPRPLHPATDEAAQAHFVEETAPLLPSRPGKSTRTSRSKSGSRTKPASASTAPSRGSGPKRARGHAP